jgi:preprotein translocase subunit SecG
LTILAFGRYNLVLLHKLGGLSVTNYLDIALIITSIALIVCVVLQNKGVGLGGLTGADTGGVFTARRGIEKTLFYITIGLSVLFFILTVVVVVVNK